MPLSNASAQLPYSDTASCPHLTPQHNCHNLTLKRYMNCQLAFVIQNATFWWVKSRHNVHILRWYSKHYMLYENGHGWKWQSRWRKTNFVICSEDWSAYWMRIREVQQCGSKAQLSTALTLCIRRYIHLACVDTSPATYWSAVLSRHLLSHKCTYIGYSIKK